jgi:hypothetical protein
MTPVTIKARFQPRLAKALLLSCFLLLGVEAQAADLVWKYTTTNVGPTVTIERANNASGPFMVVTTLPSSSTRFYVVPDNFFYRVSNPVGASNTVQVLIPADAGALKESICRAAKAMGGNATTLAGRLRKEIPCL